MGIVRNTLAFIAKVLVVKEKHRNIAIQQYREYQCRSCPFMNENLTCQKCGCLLDVKWTALTNRTGDDIELTHCPIGNWNDIEIANYYNHIKKTKT